MAITTNRLADLDLDVVDTATFQAFEAEAAREAWLTTMWGIRPGESSPVCRPAVFPFDPAISRWLTRLWGLGA